MTLPKVIKNRYCDDPEDRVIEYSCPSCRKCYLFVASKKGGKNGRCVFGGPFGGSVRVEE